MTRRFTLAGLLRLRKVQEEQAKAELLLARERARRHLREENRLREALAGARDSAASVDSLRAIAAARASTTRMLGELDALGVVLENDVQARAAVQARARRDALALERLEARHAEALAAQELRAEQHLIDEAAVRGFLDPSRKEA